MHVVERYDTLWKIARRYYPDRDPREVVWALRQANPGVDPGSLRLEQEVILPGRRPGEEEVSTR
ncbi:MAG: LysM domain-containing protein [Candidatus Thermoplasmatota archaeon]|nr:LysM domain-containing protein [Candidatus Thermoplasmatota archaeon]